jgi:hypothetical protein
MAHSIRDTMRLFLYFDHETLQCEARVVRVEPRNGQFGVAVELNRMYFVENERAGGNLFRSFDTVDGDKSRIKARPEYPRGFQSLTDRKTRTQRKPKGEILCEALLSVWLFVP